MTTVDLRPDINYVLEYRVECADYSTLDKYKFTSRDDLEAGRQADLFLKSLFDEHEILKRERRLPANEYSQFSFISLRRAS